MKNFKKILVAVLSIIMVISMVACTGDPQETPAPESSKPEASQPEASTPEGTKPEGTTPEGTTPEGTTPEGTTPEDTNPGSSETDPIVPEVDINDSMKGFVVGEGDILDGKPTADNGYSGTIGWTGADVDNYVIMSGNAAENSSTSAIRVHINVTADALISFSVKVDSAEGDVFYVLLDNARYGKGDYVAGTYIVKMIVAAGEHTISLVYQKDSSGAAGADAAYVSKFTVVESDVSALPTELTMTLEKTGSFDWAGATTLEVEDNVTVMNGGSKGNIGSRNFIYLKKSHNYPRADMPFTVAEDGTYDFVLTICAKKRNPGILSTGLVQIDDGPMYLLSSEHGDRNEVLEYFAGVTETLTKGEHVMHFYLTDDFDDSSIKSIYFDQVSFAKTTKLQMQLDAPAGFENATKVEVETATDKAAASTGKLTNEETGVVFEYAYMKKTADNPHITVNFTVAEAGKYNFAIALMAYESTLPRTGLVQIDDGAKYYINSLHGDRHLINEYFMGISAELTAGEHTMTFYLADDFDNTTVKSTYFDFFSFVKA